MPIEGNASLDHTPCSCSCNCQICQFAQLVNGHLPALLQTLDDVNSAHLNLIYSPEARDAMRGAIRWVEDMDDRSRTLGMILIDPAARNALQSIIRRAERGEI